jgi:hypothetical protein
MIALQAAVESKILPALLAQYIFNKTNGIFIVGIFAVVVVTASLYDLLRIKRKEIQTVDVDRFLVVESHQEPLCISNEKQSKILKFDVEEKTRKESAEFLRILRLRGYVMQRVKEKKTVVKCVRLNDNMELTWNGRNPLKMMSGSSNYQLCSLVSVFLCSSENKDKQKSKFILEFQCKKVLCFSCDSLEESLFFIRNFDNIRKILKENSEFFTVQSNNFSIESMPSNTSTISSCFSHEHGGTTRVNYSGVSESPVSMKSLSKQHSPYRKGFSQFNPLYRKREVVITTKFDRASNPKSDFPSYIVDGGVLTFLPNEPQDDFEEAETHL